MNDLVPSSLTEDPAAVSTNHLEPGLFHTVVCVNAQLTLHYFPTGAFFPTRRKFSDEKNRIKPNY